MLKADILKQKLPMALIHEGIGDVVYDPQGVFKAQRFSRSWKRVLRTGS